MPAPVAAVGVDNGGTWIRLAGIDAKGRCVWSLKQPSPTLKQLPAFLRRQLRHSSPLTEILVVGSKGVWKTSARRAMTKALQGLAKKVHVMSDVEAAWLAAFGPKKTSGILVISGTGSIAFGKDKQTTARAGGLGPQVGDEGSGYWIGHQWALRNSLPVKGKSVRDIAALTATVFKQAHKKNPIALRLINEAHTHLVMLVLETAGALGLKGPIPLAVSGSLLKNAWFQKGFLSHLKRGRVSYKRILAPADVAGSLARHIMSHGSR